LIKLQIGGAPGRWEEVITGTPKTDAERTEITTGELERWIKGIMEATGESIRDWNVVNEPIDDNNPSQLKKAPASPGANDFYWQDYLGKDYTRTAVKFARQYGGNDLKLFVNDYGLVNNAKCQGLIDMIKYWEQDNVTKIDGIGTQMTLTCSEDEATQKSNEDQVVAMFNLLKETGKLIRISALDMRIATTTGALINTSMVTVEQQQAMSKYYNFVIRKYFEIIPVAQRYGIAIGNPIESATNAGLWDNNFSRKFTFSGVADGLAGQGVKHE
jgi:GH35 family endo-1,4-beta-xylanase